METIAASSRWAGVPLSLERLRRLLELDPAGIVAHELIRERELQELREFLPRRSILALPLLGPLPNGIPAGGSIPFRMGSLLAEDRRDALARGQRALELADEAEIPFVIVPPVELETPTVEQVKQAAASGKRGKRGNRDPRRWELLREQRGEAARRQLDSFLGTLRRLLDHAARYDRRLALSLGGLPSQLPDVAEIESCLIEFAGGPLVLWIDLVDEMRYQRTGGAGSDRLRGDLSGSIAGLMAHDGALERSYLPLGAGELDLTTWDELKDPAAAPRGAALTPAPKEGSDAEPSSGRAADVAMPAAPAESKGRPWAIDLDPAVAEEDLADTRERLKRFLSGPEKPEFDLFRKS